MRRFDEFYEDHKALYDPHSESGQKRIIDLTEVVREYIDLPENSIILDVGCGCGISTIALINRGYRAFGIDIRHNALVLGKEYISEKTLNIPLTCGDVRRMPFIDESIDGASLMFNPFPHWTLGDFRKISSELFRILKPGGKCVMEFNDFIQLIIQGQWRDVIVESTGNSASVSIGGFFNAESGTISRTYIAPDSGNTYSTNFHLWSQWLIDFMLVEAGFCEVHFIRQRTDSPRKIAIARKE